MSKKSSKRQQERSLVGTILGIVVIALAIIFSEITGIDLLSVIDEAEPDTTIIIDSPDNPRPAAAPPVNVQPLLVGNGSGARKDFWAVYFNAPTGESDRSTYVNGIDVPLASAIGNVERTLDIAAFELNNEVLINAIVDAHERGVRVRVVTDDEHGVEDDEGITDLLDAGIAVVDDSRTALMHNKFMILDQQVVWTGSWNYTSNGTYRNNNNAVVMRSQRAVRAYQIEFDEMFVNGEFGPRSTEGSVSFSQNGTPVKIFFAAEDDVVSAIVEELDKAQDSIRFMAFSFTQDDIGNAMRERAADGINLQGIFETVGSRTQFSEMPFMFCAGFDVRQDGNKYILHHKVIIIDDHTVLTGSFNFSANATESNDENLLIIEDPDFAALYLQEFDRRWAEASPPEPEDIDCE